MKKDETMIFLVLKSKLYKVLQWKKQALQISEVLDTIIFLMPRCGDYKFLQYQYVDTTKFCNEKADITNFTMKKGETMNFL